MKDTVQARLDPETSAALAKLVTRLGWSPSHVVREGLRLLAASQPERGQRRITGMGRFASRVRDLGSNKKHLAGFGS